MTIYHRATRHGRLMDEVRMKLGNCGRVAKRPERTDTGIPTSSLRLQRYQRNVDIRKSLPNGNETLSFTDR